jgi:hypothetical protein
VIHLSRCGLCNRLRGLAAAGAIAESCGAQLRLAWEPSTSCEAYFEDLFEPVCPMATPEEIIVLRQRPEVIVMEGKLATAPPDKLCPTPRLMALWTSHVRSIRPLPHILRQIDDFQAANWSHPMIGVHVRRTDKTRQAVRLGDDPPDDQSVIDAMRAEIGARPDTRFFLATDNEASRRQFQKEFGERVRAVPSLFHAPDPGRCSPKRAKHARHTSIEAAVVDLLLLSRTHHILGTPRSSFSVHASVLGDVPLTLICHRG